MKKLITTLVITLSIMGFFARDSHAWKPGQNLVKVLDTVPFIDPASSNEDAVDDMEFTGVGFGNNGPFEAQCGLSGNFDPTNPACVTAKAECGAALRSCVVFECKSKDRGNRYKCGKDEWYDCSLTISYYISGSKSYSDTEAWNECFNSPETAQGETDGWVPGQSDDGVETDNVTDPSKPDDFIDPSNNPNPPQYPATNSLQAIIDYINSIQDPVERQAAIDEFRELSRFKRLAAAVNQLPEDQRAEAWENLVRKHQLQQLADALNSIQDDDDRKKASDFLILMSLTEEEKQQIRDYVAAIEEAKNAQINPGVITTRPNLDGVDLTLDGIDRDGFITDDGIDAQAFTGGGCTLSSAQGLSNAWYLILGLLPLLQSLARKRK